MSRLKLILPFLKLLVIHPRILLKSLFHTVTNQSNQDHVISTHGMNNGLPCVDLLDMLPDFNSEIFPYTFLNGTSTTIDIAILKALASSFKDCTYLEIGSWRGESLANVADVSKECVSISL